MIEVSPIPAANVSAVPQRSLLRYPGGKTWLVPHIRVWLRSMKRPRLLVEPFAGGGIVTLTAIMENLAEESLMAELDNDVAALWKAALHFGPELANRISSFTLTRDSVVTTVLPESSGRRGTRVPHLGSESNAARRRPGSRGVFHAQGGEWGGNCVALVSENPHPPIYALLPRSRHASPSARQTVCRCSTL